MVPDPNAGVPDFRSVSAPTIDFYAAFIAEMDKLTIRADMPAAAVVGECTRAAKRAQMATDDGELGEALCRFRLALTALDLGSVEECKGILSAACGWLVDLGAVDPMEADARDA